MMVRKEHEFTDHIGVGVKHGIENKDTQVSVGVSRKYESSGLMVKVKQENSKAHASFEVPLTGNLRLGMNDSCDLLAFVKNPRDGDSHMYKMGVTLRYQETE